MATKRVGALVIGLLLAGCHQAELEATQKQLQASQQELRTAQEQNQQLHKQLDAAQAQLAEVQTKYNVLEAQNVVPAMGASGTAAEAAAKGVPPKAQH